MTRNRPLLRHSLYLVGASVVVSLALTIAYALSGASGPGDVISAAQAAFARGEYLRVISDLDLNERSISLQRDPSKRRALWRLRYRSYLALQHPERALRDLDLLIRDLPEPGDDLRLDHIRLLAMAGKGDRALAEARAFLADHPDDAMALELAGEAAQTAYRDDLLEVRSEIELDLGALTAKEEGFPALLSFLFRPEADDEVGLAIETLQRLYARNSKTFAAWQSLHERLRRLRARIQEALSFFQKSLEGDAQPVAAFRGLALSLEQARRFDDLILLCEIYRHRFDHQYVLEAGSIAAWTLIGLGLDAAAEATTLRWYTPGTAEKRVAEGSLGPAIGDLLLARVVAAWHRRDKAALQRAQRDAGELIRAGAPARLAQLVALALRSDLIDAEDAGDRLERAARLALRTPTPHGQQDLLEILMPVWIDWLRNHGADESKILEALRTWQTARKATTAPWLALVDYQISVGNYSGADSTLNEVEKLARGDEHLLELRKRIASELYRDVQKDGPGLLAQCESRGTLVPEVPHPVGYLLCGETALTLDDPRLAPIVIQCGRAATNAMPWARAGKLLEIRGELLAGRPDQAVELARKLVESRPPDGPTLALAIRACREADQPPTDLLWLAMKTLDRAPELTTEILRRAEADSATTVLPFARRVLADTEPPPLSRLLAASALAQGGDTGVAERILVKIPESDRSTPELRAATARLLALVLRLRAEKGTGDEPLARLASDLFARFAVDPGDAPSTWLRLADDLERSHPETAWRLATSALGTAAPEERNGSTFALAARLALHRGHLALAEQHATAALAFSDGRGAAELLAKMCLVDDRPERALRVYRLVTEPTDAALAIRCGAPEASEPLLRRALAENPGDLLAHATLAAAGLPIAESALPDLAPENEAGRDRLLVLLSLLDGPEFATEALSRAEELAASHPSIGSRLLLARAMMQAGRADEAARIHSALNAEGVDSAPLWSEVANASTDPSYRPSGPLLQKFATAAAGGRFADLPFAFAAATLQTAATIEADGKAPGLAARLRATVWQTIDPSTLPEPLRPTFADIETLLAFGLEREAWLCLDRLRPTLEGPERIACVARMLTIAEPLDRFSPTEQRTFYAAFVKLADVEAPQGALVHFLLDHGEAFADLRLPEERRRALLLGHLDLVATGRDDDSRCRDSVERLVALDGPEKTLDAIEKTLRAHPTSLELWLQRADLLAKLAREHEGVDDLRRVLRHAISPRHWLAFVTRAATAFAITPEETGKLGHLPKRLRTEPTYRLAAGLAALRSGRPDEALGLLEQVSAGGAHRLLALAEAQLMSTLDDGAAKARQTLRCLADQFGDSAPARYAESFIRQLAPR